MPSPFSQAYELFRTCGGSATFPLILMDLSMPVCDGWTAASYIRSLERACGWPPCRIVACTSEDLSPGSPALARCWDVGMDAAVVSWRMFCVWMGALCAGLGGGEFKCRALRLCAGKAGLQASRAGWA